MHCLPRLTSQVEPDSGHGEVRRSFHSHNHRVQSDGRGVRSPSPEQSLKSFLGKVQYRPAQSSNHSPPSHSSGLGRGNQPRTAHPSSLPRFVALYLLAELYGGFPLTICLARRPRVARLRKPERLMGDDALGSSGPDGRRGVLESSELSADVGIWTALRRGWPGRSRRLFRGPR